MWGLGPDTGTPLGEQLERLARACRVLARQGHGHMSLGHLSLRDPEGRGFWLKVRGLGLDEVRGAGDFILLDFDGRTLEGSGGRHAEWPIHAEIHRARADVHVVAHSHPFYASTFSATAVELRAVAAEGNFLHEQVAYFRRMPGLIADAGLGRELAGVLGGCGAVLMKNHGITTCAPSIPGAALASIFLERACRAQLLVEASGLPWSEPEDLKPGGASRLELHPGLVAELWGHFERQLDRADSAPR